VKNISFIVITYDPSFNAFLMLTIDQFLTIVCLPLPNCSDIGTAGLPYAGGQSAHPSILHKECLLSCS